jgi:glycosyltransferase involved in cell wall biosynthesis
VEEGDVQAMAAGIARLADEPDHAARLGEAGRRRVLSRFTVDHHLQDLRSLLDRVAREGRD